MSGPLPREMPFRVSAVRAVVDLGDDASRVELVDRGLDVVDREVEDREARGLVIGFRIRDDARARAERDLEETHVVELDGEAERVGVEGAGGVDVIDGEAAEGGGVGEHGFSGVVRGLRPRG